MNGGADIVNEARPRQLRRAHPAADRLLRLEHQHRSARARENDRRAEAVGPRADDDRVVFAQAGAHSLTAPPRVSDRPAALSQALDRALCLPPLDDTSSSPSTRGRPPFAVDPLPFTSGGPLGAIAGWPLPFTWAWPLPLNVTADWSGRCSSPLANRVSRSSNARSVSPRAAVMRAA